MGLKAVYALLVAGCLMGVSTTAQSASLKVKTAAGEVAGKTINDGKVKAFLGLPYAAAPVGDLRWRNPQPVAPWKGVRDATKFGAHCAQSAAFQDMVFLDGVASENCLFLNVYAPANATAKSKLPVMFWIHGGGFVGGASSEPRHNGDFIPTKDVLLVTINYRLGIFGFLATSELAKEGNGIAGNYGFADQIAALEWVKQNIRNFGGDPENVTIFGESAGSFSVSTLMASPAAKGLFQKAIGESGSAIGLGLGYEPLELREKSDDKWAASLGITTLGELRALPTEKLVAEASGRNLMRFLPDIDGKLLVEQVPETYAAGRQAHVPLLAGWNRDESSGVGEVMTVEKWKAFATKNFQARAEEFLTLYPGQTDEQAARSAADYAGDTFIALGTWRWVEAHRKTGESPVYRYHFELPALPSKFHSDAAAFHSDDIEYIFGTLETRPGETIRPEDRKLSEQMMSYWTNFAKTGDPNGPGLPEWPRYGKTDELIHLDSTITAGPDMLRGRYEFLMKGMPVL